MKTLHAYQIYDADHAIEQAGAKRPWMDVVTNAYHCLPLVVANQLGWEIRVDTEVRARWNGGYHPKDIKISAGKTAADSHFGYGILTFHMYYLFETPEDVNLLVTGPVNRPRKNIAPLEGLIEADWSHMTFTMNWQFTAPTTVTWHEGDVICRLLPYPRDYFEDFRLKKIPHNEMPKEMQEKHLEWARRRVDLIKDISAKGDEQVKKERGSAVMKDYVHTARQKKIVCKHAP